MSLFLQQVLSGLVNGSVVGGVALAICVVYNGSGVVNIAQAQLATLSAFIAWQVAQTGAGFWLALLAAVLGSFALGVVVERVLIRPVEGGSELTMLIVTVALLLGLNALIAQVWGVEGHQIASPFGHGTLHVLGAVLTAQQLGLLGAMVATAVAVELLFRRTRLGLQLKAVASEPLSSRYVGINVGAVLAVGWGLAAAVGAVAGVMVAPVSGVGTDVLSNTLLLAFAALCVGGLGSRVGAMLGGLVLGVVSNLVTNYVTWTRGDLASLIPFVLILAVLVLRPDGMFGRAQGSRL